jgi:hypothetical protein
MPTDADNLVYSMNDVTLGLLLGSLIIFGWLAYRSKNIKKFQFQISVFIIVWIVGEVIQNKRIASLIPLPEIGLLIHASSMAFLTVMLWLRLYYSKRKGKTMIEDTEG